MTRCIHRTRCIRFGSEIAGLEVLGILNRGLAIEIGSYLSKLFNSEISGNAIDLCLVGKIGGKKRFIRRARMKMSSFQKKLNLAKKNQKVMKFTDCNVKKSLVRKETQFNTKSSMNWSIRLQREKENDPVEQQRRYKCQCEEQLKKKQSLAYRQRQAQLEYKKQIQKEFRKRSLRVFAILDFVLSLFLIFIYI